MKRFRVSCLPQLEVKPIQRGVGDGKHEIEKEMKKNLSIL